MNQNRQAALTENGIRDLDPVEFDAVAGGQVSRAYCVYSNGSVGVHDFSSMQSRPLRSDETCSH